MNALDAPAWFWILLAIELLGLMSAWLTRVTEGSSLQSGFQWLFMGLLAVVGGSTMVATFLGPGCLLTAGATLAAMLLAATCDFRSPAQAW